MPNDLLTRRADLTPASLRRDGDRVTVDAVITTGAPVRRRGYVERLAVTQDAVSIPGSVPLRDNHNARSIRDLLGRATSFRFEPGQIVATLEITDPTAAAMVERGDVSAVSIGYREGKRSEAREGQTVVRTLTEWRLAEVSLTDNPADPAATIRSEDNMPKDVQDQNEDRAALIQRCRAAHPALGDEWATRMEEAGDVLTDEEVITDARETAQAARQTRTAPTIRTAAPAADDPAVTLTRQAEALACRMTGTAPSEAARPFMAMGLHDFAREALTRSGVAVRTMGAEEVLTRAMHGTSDFPALLTESGNRTLAAAYQVAQSPLKTLARQSTATDFRAKSILKLGEFSGLQKISEHGEIKAMTTGEAKEGYALETFGGIFSLSRKALVNDDLGAFGRWAEMMGRNAAETEAAQLLALLAQSSGAGPVMGEDGKRLFHTDHGNIANAGAAPDESTLSAARLALRTMKGLDGKTPVNVVPKFLLVGPALETTAEKLLATIYPAKTVDAQTISLTLLVEPRLTGNSWYVFADPATAPVLEYAYLSSAPGPQLSSRDGWDVLGREFRVVLDFGCGAIDWRGAYRNAGA